MENSFLHPFQSLSGLRTTSSHLVDAVKEAFKERAAPMPPMPPKPAARSPFVDRRTDGPSLTRIARLPVQETARTAIRTESQVIVLDYSQRDVMGEERAILCQGGIWLRHARPFEVRTRVVLHLILPDLFAPLTLTGLVAKTRLSVDSSNPWMLVWFEESSQEALLGLRQYLRNQQQ